MVAAAPCWADCLTGDVSKLYTSYVCSANQVNIDHAKTIANTSIHRRVAITTRRQKDSGHHSHGHGTTRPGCHGHGTTRTRRERRPRRGHDVATTGTAMIAYKGTCPRDTTRHAKTQSYKRSNVAPCNKYPRGGASRPAFLLGPVGQ